MVYAYLVQKMIFLKGLIMQKITFIIVMMLALGSITYAGCVYKDHIFREGTVIGPIICVNGEWIRW